MRGTVMHAPPEAKSSGDSPAGYPAVRRSHWRLVLCLGAALQACSSTTADALSSADAARWLQKACGVALSAPPVLKEGKWLKAATQPGWANSVDGTVLLREDDVPKVLESLRREAGLNLRGASRTHYSYQSPDGRPQERECELDTVARQLYFRYTE